MQHNNILDKNSTMTMINDISANDATIFKYDGSNMTDISSSASYTDIANGYKKLTLELDDEDYHLLIDWDGVIEASIVGEPAIRIFVNYEIGQTVEYKQLDTDGNIIHNGAFNELGSGWYTLEPLELNLSYFEVAGSLQVLKLPYRIVKITDGTGCSATKNFVNLGFNMFGFQGERHSYFDLGQGKWINDSSVEAKASDLAKAVCHKYNLVWNDKNDPKFIGKYVKYLRSYEENVGRIRYYKPLVVPESNPANFALVQTDEDGNTNVKGELIVVAKS